MIPLGIALGFFLGIPEIPSRISVSISESSLDSCRYILQCFSLKFFDGFHPAFFGIRSAISSRFFSEVFRDSFMDPSEDPSHVFLGDFSRDFRRKLFHDLFRDIFKISPSTAYGIPWRGAEYRITRLTSISW